jgi:hypothetical protein
MRTQMPAQAGLRVRAVRAVAAFLDGHTCPRRATEAAGSSSLWMTAAAIRWCTLQTLPGFVLFARHRVGCRALDGRRGRIACGETVSESLVEFILGRLWHFLLVLRLFPCRMLLRFRCLRYHGHLQSTGLWKRVTYSLCSQEDPARSPDGLLPFLGCSLRKRTKCRRHTKCCGIREMEYVILRIFRHEIFAAPTLKGAAFFSESRQIEPAS